MDTNVSEVFSGLIEALELVRDAVMAKDKEEGMATATFYLLKYIQAFGHDQDLFARTYPLLEELKTSIETEEFDNALGIVLAQLVQYRQIINGPNSEDS
jgi:hypothetical protein